MSPRPSTIKGKIVCFVEQDWLDFDVALHEAFPQARFYRESGPQRRPQGIIPPQVKLYHRLMDTERERQDRVYMIFDPDWQPEFFRYQNPFHPDDPKEWWWSMRPRPIPFVLWQNLGGHILNDGVFEFPNTSEIHFYTTPENKTESAMAGKFFRLFAKHATNRKDLVWVRMPELEVSEAVHKGAMEWCGHRAIEWARQDPNRVLFYMKHGVSIRPTADVKPFAPPPKPKAKKAKTKP